MASSKGKKMCMSVRVRVYQVAAMCWALSYVSDIQQRARESH